MATRRSVRQGVTALAAHPLILYERGGTIRAVIDRWFRAGGVTPRVAMELGNAEAIKKLVATGVGLSVSSEVTVRNEVHAGRLLAIPLEPPLIRELGIVRRRDKPSGPALDTFLAALREPEAGRAHGRARTVSR